MTETYWKWLKQGIGTLKDNNLAKFIIFILINSLLLTYVVITLVTYNFFVGLIIGFVLYFFVITYAIYLAEK